jgi:hypothetical protein
MTSQSHDCSSNCQHGSANGSVLLMREIAIACAVVVSGCTEDTSARDGCEPVIAVDELHADEVAVLDTWYEGSSYCLRVDATAMNRPHLEVATPFDTDFLLELRALDNTTFATGVDIEVGRSGYTSVAWDPVGGEIYDVLVHVRPRPPIIGGGPRVSAQLSVRP